MLVFFSSHWRLGCQQHTKEDRIFSSTFVFSGAGIEFCAYMDSIATRPWKVMGDIQDGIHESLLFLICVGGKEIRRFGTKLLFSWVDIWLG